MQVVLPYFRARKVVVMTVRSEVGRSDSGGTTIGRGTTVSPRSLDLKHQFLGDRLIE